MSDDDNIDFADAKKKAEDRLQNLGKLSPVEYGQRRGDLAEELGVRGTDLDKEYRERRKAAKSGEGAKDLFREIEPWEEEIDGTRLIAELVAAVKSHLVLPIGAAETIALWIIFTHCFDAFEIAPVLGVTSPTPECGKTTAQCHRPPAAAIEQRDGPGGVPRRGEVEADAPDR
jgi:hypothetical protein